MNGLGSGATAVPASPLPFSRVLITGADGFVGRQLVPVLATHLQFDARIVLASRAPRDAASGRCEHVRFDLTEPAGVRAAIADLRPDLVIHLAAQSSIGQSAKTAVQTWSTNLCGSLSLAGALADIVPKVTLLFASSVEVYGLTFNHEIATEHSPLRPRSAYARSKAAAEAMFDDILPASARLIVARPCNHSGPGQDEKFVLPSFAGQIARVEKGASPIIRVGNLDAERDFLDVRDVVSAYMALIEHADRLPSRNTFNIASGQPVRIGALLDRLRALSVTEIAVEQDVERIRPNEVSRASINPFVLRQTVGWSPRYSIDDMLVDILQASRKQFA